jgi:exosortase H (IPTLxxWG-CTERM-specific)
LGAAARSPVGPRWFAGKRPVFRFVGLFVLLMGAFTAVSFVPAMSDGVLPAYMRFNARVSTVILNVFGEGAEAQGTSVVSPRYSVDIRHGCDAIAPSALFIAAVIAFPGSVLAKIPGLIAGTLVLAVINLVRIVSLFYTGIHWPRGFELMHVDVWQPAFVVLALALWVAWALWATRDPSRASHVSG